MPRPDYPPMDYLTKNGRKIYFRILRHVQDHDIMMEVDTIELSMLANSYDAYDRAATYCNEKGFSREIESKQGSFGQIVPEYTVMRNEYNNILKHSSKFGMTPGDREKIFNGLKKKKPVSITDDLD